VSLAQNLGLSNLDLNVQGSAQASLAYSFNLTLEADAGDPANAYVVAGSNPALSVAATLSAPNAGAHRRGRQRRVRPPAGRILNAAAALEL
jgi:hypothetical protein